jgi:hypothetical protein
MSWEPIKQFSQSLQQDLRQCNSVHQLLHHVQKCYPKIIFLNQTKNLLLFYIQSMLLSGGYSYYNSTLVTYLVTYPIFPSLHLGNYLCKVE